MTKLSCKKIEGLIHKYVNTSRRKRGLNSLKGNFGLKRLARNHSWRMAKSKHIWHGEGVHLAKNNITNKGILDFLIHLFYSGYSGENVAMMPLGRVMGFKRTINSSKDVALAFHKSWMGSPGHRRNILDSNFNLIGVGVKKRGKYYYATQIFYG